MKKEDKMDLEGQIKKKEEDLENRRAVLARYADSRGRDRWYNRGCQDVITMERELIELRQRQELIQ